MRLVSFALCLAVAVSALAADEVRPISDAERAAVTAAADYLSRGPEAIYQQLASTVYRDSRCAVHMLDERVELID